MSKYQALIDALALEPQAWSYDSNQTPFYNDPEGNSRGGDCDGTYWLFGEDFEIDGETYEGPTLSERCSKADANYIAEANPATIRALLADLERAEKALNRIASWPEGEQVTPSFDEPNAANIARDYLSGITDADGAQTSPIPCDVFSGGSLFKKGTPICDLAEHIDTEAARLVWAMANMGMSNDHSRNFTTHVLRVGGMGDIHDCRTYIDAAMAQMAGGE